MGGGGGENTVQLDSNDHGFNEHPVFNERKKIPDFSKSLSFDHGFNDHTDSTIVSKYPNEIAESEFYCIY